MKKQQGITLIALVITIIVLLILAGVSISMVIGDNGILKQAKQAEVDTKNAEEAEQRALEELKTEMDRWVPGENSTPTVDFEAITADVIANPSTYLAKAQALGQDESITDIGIGTDGEVVNLKLWYYVNTDDGQGVSLGDGDGCAGSVGYLGEFNDDGSIKGKMPQYIYMGNKVYPVTKLINTFEKLENLKIAPDIPTTVVSMDATFKDTNITSIVIPENVKILGTQHPGVFYACSELKTISLPESLTMIGPVAFESCNKLTNLAIPNSVISIGERAFSGCSNLLSLDVPKGVTAIGDNAFSGCYGLESINIHDNVTSIGNYAFGACHKLKSIRIPSSITSIGENAFYDCYDLSEVKFEMTTPPKFSNNCFKKQYYKDQSITFYFKNDTVYNSFIDGTHYDSAYGIKSTNYSWQ